MHSYRTFEMSDFSGGESDSESDVPTTYERAFNLVIDETGKLKTRNSIQWIYEDFSKFIRSKVSGLNRYANAMFRFKEDLFICVNNSVFVRKANGQIYEVVSYRAESAFPKSIPKNNPVTVLHYSDYTLLVAEKGWFPMRIFRPESAAGWEVTSLGAPDYDYRFSAKFSQHGSASTDAYIYAIHYVHTILIEGREVKERGSVTYLRVDNAHAISSSNPCVISDIVKFDNKNFSKWYHQRIETEVYRTTLNGSVLRLVHTFGYDPAGSALYSFEDRYEDTQIEHNQIIYSHGLDSDYRSPEKCRSIAQCNNVTYYGNIISKSSDNLSSVIRFSEPLAPGHIPDDAFINIDGEIRSIFPLSNRVLLVFTYSEIFRLEIQDTGSRLFTVKSIENVAVVSARSIVKAGPLVFFLAKTGIYYTDGFICEKLRTHIYKRYFSYLKSSHLSDFEIEGSYDPSLDRIYWVFTSERGVCEKIVFYLNFWKPGLYAAVTTITDSRNTRGFFYIGDTELLLVDKSLMLCAFSTNPFQDADFIREGSDSKDADPIFVEFISNVTYLGYSGRKVVPHMFLDFINLSQIDMKIRSEDDGRISDNELIRFRYTPSTPPIGSGVYEPLPIVRRQINFHFSGLHLNHKRLIMSLNSAIRQRLHLLKITLAFSPLASVGQIPDRSSTIGG